MKADSNSDSFSGQKVVVIYLSAVLVLASVATTGPWLHTVLEHLSFNREFAHVHASNHYFKHSHPSKVTHSHSTETSSDSDQKENSPSDNHEHHGLSELIACGILELADSSIDVPLPTGWSVDFLFQFSNAEYPARFDFVQAKRPPPSFA